jgi:LemA protein
MKGALIVLAVIVVIVLILGGSLMGDRNDLVTERESINSAYAQVDNQMQRRADLIPNLVSTVKGMAAHEQSVIDSVTKARAQMAGAQTPQEKFAANGQLDSALSRLLVVVENYPDIKANTSFQDLQTQLEGTENRISIARRDYNNAIQKYDTDLAVFPKNIAASMFGFQRNDAYFKADAEAKQVPKVQF